MHRFQNFLALGGFYQHIGSHRIGQFGRVVDLAQEGNPLHGNPVRHAGVVVKLVQHFAHQRLHHRRVVLFLFNIFHRRKPRTGDAVHLQFGYARPGQALQENFHRAVGHF